MVRQFRYLALECAFATVMTSSFVFADSEAPPSSYKQKSPGGKYVFVMIAPMSLEEDAGNWIEEKGSEIREIRRVYSRSGLYRNDGSTEPLWTVDWYAYGVEIASDGIHLIRHGPWASSTDQEAVSFFANGKLIRTYQIKELIDNPLLLDHTVSHFFWQKGGWFDDARLRYTLRTIDGNQFVFDVRTGETLSKSRPTGNILWFLFVVLGTSVLGIIAWLAERRWRQSRSSLKSA